MKKKIVVHVLAVLAVLCLIVIDAEAKKPEITRYDAQYLDRQVAINLQWQSSEAIVSVRVAAGKEVKEIKIDPFDNKKTRSGYSGELNVVLQTEPVMYQESISYTIQVEDEDGQKSNLVSGKVAIPIGSFAMKQHDQWGKDNLAGTAKSGQKDMIEQLRQVASVLAAPPVLADVFVNNPGSCTVTFKTKATHSVGLKEIDFRVFDGSNKLFDSQQILATGKYWEGTSRDFTLGSGNYSVIAQAIDASGSTSLEKKAAFTIKAGCEPIQPQVPQTADQQQPLVTPQVAQLPVVTLPQTTDQTQPPVTPPANLPVTPVVTPPVAQPPVVTPPIEQPPVVQPPIVTPPAQPLGSGMEVDTDRPGLDYRSFDLPAADPNLCQNACASETNCKAFTYVRPGVQGPSARCWLKSNVPNPVKNNCCVSGVKTTPPIVQPPVQPPIITPPSPLGSGMEVDTDRPGLDYRSFDLPAADPNLCQNACTSETNCKAFTYVRPGVQGPGARCWLKSNVPNPVKNNCCVSGVKTTPPVVQPPVTQQNLPTISEPVIYTNGNIAGVQNNPTRETTFSIDATNRVTFIYTYHYFNSGKLPGTIALRHSDGTVYGHWQAAGALGQGGVQNAYWFVRPNVEIKAGSYTVIDSDKATWSQNSGSSGAGFVEIRGIKTGTSQPPAIIIKPPQPSGSAVQLDSLTSLQIIKSVASQGSAAFKKNENLRTDLVMQTTSWDKTPYKMYEGVYNLVLKSSRKVLLSGNAQATEGWNVDNFILLEVFNYSGKLLKQIVIGNHEPVLSGNVPIEKLGNNKFSFAAGEIDITNIFPVNEPFLLRASAVDYGGTGVASNVFLTMPPVTPPVTQQNLPTISEPVIYTNGNIAGVQNNPTRETTFSIDATNRVTFIYTYHYFNSGKLPGTIALRHSDGTVYGPWQAAGALGQGGVQNAYWFVRPNVEIKAGSYTVIDSDKATWSQNSGSSGAGFVEIRGVKTVTTPLGSGMEVDTDRPGLDYRSFDLPAADPNLCQNACTSETNCKAFTYVRPGVQGPSARCWLKSSVPNPVKNNCCVSGVKTTPPIVQPPVTQQNLPTISEPVIYTNGNIAGVQNNPTRETTFTINATYRITFIYTYHYFNSGKLPGTIALRHSDGTVYGPWQAAGALGQGGVQNAYWFVRPNVEIKSGSYTVVDSDKATWSQNSGSSGAGFVEIRGTITQLPIVIGQKELLTGTDMKGLQGWTIQRWMQPTNDQGEVTSDKDGIRFRNTSGNTRMGIMQAINADVSGAQKLILTAVVKAVQQALDGTGWQGREAPVAVMVTYTDVSGVVRNGLGSMANPVESQANRMFWQGFYYLNPTGNSQSWNGTKVAQGSWYTYEVDLMSLNPKPKTILAVGAEGGGWPTREGMISTISLKYYGPLPTNK